MRPLPLRRVIRDPFFVFLYGGSALGAIVISCSAAGVHQKAVAKWIWIFLLASADCPRHRWRCRAYEVVFRLRRVPNSALYVSDFAFSAAFRHVDCTESTSVCSHSGFDLDQPTTDWPKSESEFCLPFGLCRYILSRIYLQIYTLIYYFSI